MTTQAGVVGKPIGHSLSPLLHATAYRELGLGDWVYGRFEVDHGELVGFVASLDDSWRGLSVTMPVKEDAFALATSRSQVADRTGAVNTLVRTASGWAGDNTDVHGVRAALTDAGLSSGALARAVPVIIGSGATARSALAALRDLGANRVSFVVRDRVREQTLAQAAADGVEVVDASLLEAPVVVNTVPGEAADEYARAWRAPAVPDQIVLDVRYAADRTPLAASVISAGATLVGGIEMLVHQAAAQVRLMTGQEPPLAAMQEAGRRAMLSR